MESRIPPKDTKILMCNERECIKDFDKDVLICFLCGRSVHYRCSLLPAYQIHVFNSKRNQRYYCQNFIRVPPELLELIPKRDQSFQSFKTIKENDNLKRDISACEALIKKQQENEEHLKTIIEDQKNTMTDLKRKLESGPAFHTLE